MRQCGFLIVHPSESVTSALADRSHCPESVDIALFVFLDRVVFQFLQPRVPQLHLGFDPMPRVAGIRMLVSLLDRTRQGRNVCAFGPIMIRLRYAVSHGVFLLNEGFDPCMAETVSQEPRGLWGVRLPVRFHGFIND